MRVPNCIKARGRREGGDKIAGKKLKRERRSRGERNEWGVIGMTINFGSLAQGTAGDKLSNERAHGGPPVVAGEEDHGRMNARMTIGGGVVDKSNQRAVKVSVGGDV